MPVLAETGWGAAGRGGPYPFGVRQTMTRPAGRPLRVVLVALLLAGLGLWQSWQCTDDMAPLLMPAAMSAYAGVHDHGGAHEQPPAGDGHGSLVAACMTVLAAVAGALVLMGVPRRLLALVVGVWQVLVRPVGPLPRAATLAQLCVMRT